MKANKVCIGGGLRTHRRFLLIHKLNRKYSERFQVKIEAISIQGDHIHIVARLRRRSEFQNYLRVLAGQIAQRFQGNGLSVTGTPTRKLKIWRHRPFTSVATSHQDWRMFHAYIRLNELEALGKIPYQKARLKGLSSSEWELLWTFAFPRL